MSSIPRRFVITSVVFGLAAVLLLVTIVGRKSAAPAAAQPTASPAPPAPDATAPDVEPAAGPPASATVAEGEPLDLADLAGLRTRRVSGQGTPATMGSLDPREAPIYLEFSLTGAGIERVTLSDFWQTAAQSRRAEAHYEALDRGDANPPPLPPDSERYVLQTARSQTWIDPRTNEPREISIPLLAAHTIEINGSKVTLLDASAWTETAPGAFEALIVDEDDSPVARIQRRFVLGTHYDLTIEQRIANLTPGALEVAWIQYGPGDLIADRARYIDMRRFRFGYRPDPVQLPDLIASRDGDLIITRKSVVSDAAKAIKVNATDPAKAQELTTLWPNRTSIDGGYDLAWFASTNRYFALAVFPPTGVALDPLVARIRTDVVGPKGAEHVFTGLYSPAHTVAPQAELSLDAGVYAGPLERRILGDDQPMASLAMRGLILYQMSTFCAVCTFQWLAVGLLQFLSGVHFVVRDWGVAIILLVVVVRTLLHPLTKRAQINMQRFGKVMSDIKPEIDRLQKKYPDDPKKLQQEQMRLMRERGASPFQMLGCLPMFLQMPIWVALYAMLYFAFELRHQPAFWGVFQLFGHWPFLADLSAADHCFWEFAEPFRFVIWNVTGINLLPVLLGVVFFIQQKYMSPPPSATMTKEQIQQQKIMKILMVVMFPTMLYSAPSGLTLYICTSSFLGIIESRYIRSHIKAMDLKPPGKTTTGKKKKPKDPQARAFAEAMERAKARVKQKREPVKKFKKRR